jgi:hypothetical protein
MCCVCAACSHLSLLLPLGQQHQSINQSTTPHPLLCPHVHSPSAGNCHQSLSCSIKPVCLHHPLEGVVILSVKRVSNSNPAAVIATATAVAITKPSFMTLCNMLCMSPHLPLHPPPRSVSFRWAPSLACAAPSCWLRQSVWAEWHACRPLTAPPQVVVVVVVLATSCCRCCIRTQMMAGCTAAVVVVVGSRTRADKTRLIVRI